MNVLREHSEFWKTVGGELMAQPGLGKNLRAIRLQLGRSLTDVASATEISASFISMVENGSSDISIGRLLRLTQYYGVQIAEVLPGPAAPAPEVIRSGERRRLRSNQEQLEMEFLADARYPLRPSLVQFQAGARTLDSVRDAGDAFLYVLEGEIVVDVGRHDPIVLAEGDSAYLPGELPRRYENQSEKPVLLLSVVLRKDAVVAMSSTTDRPALVAAPRS
jgi:XRE family transcriptional regulator, regulator of sulfur utilization